MEENQVTRENLKKQGFSYAYFDDDFEYWWCIDINKNVIFGDTAMVKIAKIDRSNGLVWSNYDVHSLDMIKHYALIYNDILLKTK